MFYTSAMARGEEGQKKVTQRGEEVQKENGTKDRFEVGGNDINCHTRDWYGGMTYESYDMSECCLGLWT